MALATEGVCLTTPVEWQVIMQLMVLQIRLLSNQTMFIGPSFLVLDFYDAPRSHSINFLMYSQGRKSSTRDCCWEIDSISWHASLTLLIMSQFYRLSHYRAAGRGQICLWDNEAVRLYGIGSCDEKIESDFVVLNWFYTNNKNFSKLLMYFS